MNGGCHPAGPRAEGAGPGGTRSGPGQTPMVPPASGLSPRSYSQDTLSPREDSGFLPRPETGCEGQKGHSNPDPLRPMQCCSGLTGCPGRAVFWAD